MDYLEQIYTRLWQEGVSKEVIAEIRRVGPEKVNWTLLDHKLSPATLRFINVKLGQHEKLYDNTNS